MGATAVPTTGPDVVGRRRYAYLDSLKVVLVTGVIVGHVLITYADIGTWAYRETSSNDAFLVPAALLVSLGSLFAMGAFFLIAGLLTPGPLRRKGSAAFLRDRAVRLGIPFVVFLLLIYPTVKWAARENESTTIAWYLQAQWTDLDPGPLWFVLALLIFSVGYVGWRALRPASSSRRPLPASLLPVVAGIIAISTFLLRVWLPIDSHQPFELHVWQWPQCIGMFVVGLACAENSWLQPVPDRVRRGCGVAAVVGLLGIIGAFAVSRESIEPFAGGATWQAVVVAVCEGILAVALAVWLLAFFQRHADRGGPFARALGRAAFGAYVLQAVVVVAIALLLQSVEIEPSVKALIVAPLAVVGSFALSWLLTRLPGVNRVV